jgi:uncharacterized protein YqgC (DUF456 family)
MSPGAELLVGLVILLGLAGVVVQIVPGSLLVLGAIAVWAVVTGGAAAWWVLAVSTLAVGGAAVAKYLLAGRHLRRAEVPSSTVAWGAAVGIVGFFVVPVIGLPLGFVLGVYVAELVRLRDVGRAWPATVAALRAAGIALVVELAGALVATGAWLAAVLWPAT